MLSTSPKMKQPEERRERFSFGWNHATCGSFNKPPNARIDRAHTTPIKTSLAHESNAISRSGPMSCSGAFAIAATAEHRHSTLLEPDHSTHQPTLASTLFPAGDCSICGEMPQRQRLHIPVIERKTKDEQASWRRGRPQLWLHSSTLG
jgi:hypothetical protein